MRSSTSLRSIMMAVATALAAAVVIPAATPAAAATARHLHVTDTTTFTVPPGVTSLEVTVMAGSGQANDAGVPGGMGGIVHSIISTTPGEQLKLVVGVRGEVAVSADPDAQRYAGGRGAAYTGGGFSGHGGAASAILRGAEPLVVAGGGGGAGYGNKDHFGGTIGGAGGDGNGGDGHPGTSRDLPGEASGGTGHVDGSRGEDCNCSSTTEASGAGGGGYQGGKAGAGGVLVGGGGGAGGTGYAKEGGAFSNAVVAGDGSIDLDWSQRIVTTGGITSLNPSGLGAPVVLSLTVFRNPADSVGIPAPAGTVTWYHIGVTTIDVLGTSELDAAGRSTFTVSPPAIGDYQVVAYWPGDGDHEGFSTPPYHQFVEGAVRRIAIDPASVDLGPARFGRQVTGHATVSNVGNVPWTFDHVVATSPQLTVGAGTCTTPVPARDSCTIDLTYTSLLPGAFAERVRVVGTDGTVGVLDVTAFGLDVHVTFDPAVLDAGDVIIGEVADRTVTVTNTGNTPWQLAAAEVTDPFGLPASTCWDAPIEPGTSCSLTVRFRPDAEGSVTGTLLLTEAGGLVSGLDLRVTGVQPAPVLAFDVSPVEFGDAVIGQSVERTVVVTNVGTGPWSATFANVTDPQFAMPSTTCNVPELGPGQSCSVTVRFTPTVMGASAAELQLTGDDQVMWPLALRGTGVAPVVAFDVSPVDFGDVAIGLSADRTVVVTNTGNAPWKLTYARMTGGPFAMPSTTCAAAWVAPGGTCSVTVRFRPTVAGSSAAELQLTGADQVMWPLPLRGTGVVVPPEITFEPSSLEFGNVAIGEFAERTAVVRNTGSVPWFFYAVHTTGTAYWMSGTNCWGVLLAPGDSCSVTIRFTPNQAGAASAEHQIFDLGLVGFALPLHGTGVVPRPVVTSISPARGPRAGGTRVTINGTGLAGATSVTFGGVPAKDVTCTSTQCTVTSPRGRGEVAVRVTTAGGTSRAVRAARFTYRS